MSTKICDIYEKEWIESALNDKNVFINGLTELGLSNETIIKCSKQLINDEIKVQKDILNQQYNDKRYTRHRRDIHTNYDQNLIEFELKKKHTHRRTDGEYAEQYFETRMNKLKNILGFLDLRKEDEVLTEVNIPLFKFNSPMSKGSMVIYERTDNRENKNIFNLSVLGTGLGITRGFSLSFAQSFTSCNGEYLSIYIPVTLRNSLIGVYENGVRIKNIIRTELVVDKDNNLSASVGCEKQSSKDFFNDIQPIQFLAKYPLSTAPSDSDPKIKISLKSSKEYNFQFGIKAFNLNGNCNVVISKCREIKLEFKLPPGQDYQVSSIMYGNGILWG